MKMMSKACVKKETCEKRKADIDLSNFETTALIALIHEMNEGVKCEGAIIRQWSKKKKLNVRWIYSIHCHHHHHHHHFRDHVVKNNSFIYLHNILDGTGPVFCKVSFMWSYTGFIRLKNVIVNP